MSEYGEQVQRLLATLARHGDLIAEAYAGAVSSGDKQRNGAIEALFGVNVLKPYEEDTYRLNPRLREFIADHFESYQVFQALRRVSPTTQQAEEQWRELRRLKREGTDKDISRLKFALDESILEMAYSIENNLTMLHSLIATQYGNVDDFGTKLQQNRYYARQVRLFLQDMQAIDKFAERVADEAIAAGMPDVRQLVSRGLSSRLLQWTSQIKDVQAAISNRLFEAKRLEECLKRLSRFSLWLGRHKTTDGWDVAVDEKTDVALFRPEAFELRPQPDVRETEPVNRGGLLSAIAKMPTRQWAKPAEPDAGEQLLVEDDTELHVPLDPQQVALQELAAAACATAAPISLLEWKRRRDELADVTDEAWLMFACLQLKGSGFPVEFVHEMELEPFPINEHFHDIEVRGLPIFAAA